jgi:hypothetical protein
MFAAVAALSPSTLPGAGQPGAAQTIDELTVQRINVVDANGTLRLVIANKDRMHPGVMDGVTINRPRPVAGLIFFNDEGDEVGGLAYSGQEANGERRASAQLAFDQLKQDQTVAISYSGEQRPAQRRLAGVGSIRRAVERVDSQAERRECPHRSGCSRKGRPGGACRCASRTSPRLCG